METINVYNLIILDESGSMESIKRLTISGFNEVVQTIKIVENNYPEQIHHVSLVTFNGEGIKTKLDKVAVKRLLEINHQNFKPASNTPLYDAIGLSTLKLRYDIVNQKNTHVLVTIFTDGEENSSREFTGSQIRNLIGELQETGWTFTYIGTDHDVAKVANSIGLDNVMCFEKNEDSMKAMFIRENKARMNYSRKLRNVEDVSKNYYEEENQQ